MACNRIFPEASPSRLSSVNSPPAARAQRLNARPPHATASTRTTVGRTCTPYYGVDGSCSCWRRRAQQQQQSSPSRDRRQEARQIPRGQIPRGHYFERIPRGTTVEASAPWSSVTNYYGAVSPYSPHTRGGEHRFYIMITFVLLALAHSQSHIEPQTCTRAVCWRGARPAPPARCAFSVPSAPVSRARSLPQLGRRTEPAARPRTPAPTAPRARLPWRVIRGWRRGGGHGGR